MRSSFWTRYALVGISVTIGLGLGCGGGGGGLAGCGGGSTLPSMPAPWGFPMDQAIEGGMQARITKPGFDKISALIPSLAKSALPSQAKPQCMAQQQVSLKIAGTGGDVKICDSACGMGGNGCPVWVDLRPDLAPPGGIGISMADGSNPVVNIDAAFDVHMQVPIQHRLCIFGICQGWQNDCTMHVNGPGTHVKAGIQLGIDPTSGKLTIALGTLNLVGLNLGVSDCGLLSDIFNGVLGIINAVAKSFIGDTIINLLKPQLTKLLTGFLPDPPGLASRMDLSKTLASFGAPPEAALEILAIAGGYVTAKGGGLNLGVITGANSDADPNTRMAGVSPLNSEPSLCVPVRPTYDLGQAPWNLPTQMMRQDHLLDPAAEFSGAPDPMDSMGNTQDIGLGISRTFLDLAGFHLFNSGTLCLAIGDSVLGGQLNAGTLRVLVPSLGNILDNQKAPLALVLRPEQPILFQVGAGGVADPLLKIAVTDLRVDFYAFIEERFIRLLTLAVDLNVGLDLAVTMDMNGNPAIAPMISGIDKNSIQLRVSNTDVLSEDPAKLVKLLGSLIDVAVGQLGGTIKPIALPAISGFTLDGLVIKRVQTKEDDFLGIFGSLKQDPNAMPYALPEDVVGLHRLPSTIDTHAEILDISVPPIEVIRAAALDGRTGDGDTPSVTLRLGSTGASSEWSYRIDNGGWHPWSADPKPTLADPLFLLQARHSIDVRAREKGDWTTEDQTPAHLELVIDSVPPALTIAVQSKQKSIALAATDNVSEPSTLRYAWKVQGQWTRPDRRDYLSFDEAWAATAQGAQPLVVAAYDEQGNHAETSLDLNEVNDFHGRVQSASSSGCGCDVGARSNDNSGSLAFFTLLALSALALRRSTKRSARA